MTFATTDEFRKYTSLYEDKKDNIKSISLRRIQGGDGNADERGDAGPHELRLRRKSRVWGDLVSANVR